MRLVPVTRSSTHADNEDRADTLFEDPRVAKLYDPLDPDRRDLAVYVAVVHELGARGVVDIGCGTGMFACLLADADIEVIGVDPATALLDVARHKTGAERVRWIHGIATDLPPLQVDMVTMTGNVAQVFLDDDEWVATLAAAHRALRPGGCLVFETRRPERKAWQEWNPRDSYQCVEIPGVGRVDTWDEVTEVDRPLVSFQSTIRFHAEGSTITSSSTLRFRDQEENTALLEVAGFLVREVRDAPDRPGQEYVFLAQTEESIPGVSHAKALAAVWLSVATGAAMPRKCSTAIRPVADALSHTEPPPATKDAWPTLSLRFVTTERDRHAQGTTATATTSLASRIALWLVHL